MNENGISREAPARPEERPLRVVVADDDRTARRSVVDLLRADGLQVVGEARDGREAVELTRHYKPEALVLDLVMPGLDGLGVVRALTATDSPTRIVLLTEGGDDALALLALRLGAGGYITKETDLELVPGLVRRLVAGETLVSRELTGELVRRLRAVRADGTGLRPVRSVLTDREWETLDLLCLGRSTIEIAEELVLSGETVRTYVKAILRKLGVHSRAEAVEWAVQLRADLLGTPPD